MLTIRSIGLTFCLVLFIGNSGQYTCDSNRIIEFEALCDGINDCSPEMDVGKTPCDWYPCAIRYLEHCANGKCKTEPDICGGEVTCISSQDEDLKFCKNTKCILGEFRCKTGRCIPKRKQCDGIIDCPNGDDEEANICPNKDYGLSKPRKLCPLKKWEPTGFWVRSSDSCDEKHN